MKIEKLDPAKIQAKLSRSDLVFINDIINEVCHGFRVPEFESRIGATREEVLRLLQLFHGLAASAPAREEVKQDGLAEAQTEPLVELTRGELTAIKNALSEVLRELGPEEFDTRVGLPFKEGQAMLAKLDKILLAMDDCAAGADIDF